MESQGCHGAPYGWGCHAWRVIKKNINVHARVRESHIGFVTNAFLVWVARTRHQGSGVFVSIVQAGIVSRAGLRSYSSNWSRKPIGRPPL